MREFVGSPPPGGLMEKRTHKVQLWHPTEQGKNPNNMPHNNLLLCYNAADAGTTTSN